MSRSFFDELKLQEPQSFLGVGSAMHGEQTGEMMKRLEPVLLAESPDWVLVYGDTNTTLAAALVAAKLHQRVIHVEAGLRSFDMSMPEEVNRVVTDHLAELLFAPSIGAAENLKREGIKSEIRVVGDLMVDLALKTAGGLPASPEILARLALEKKGYALATVHRASNTESEEVLKRILLGLDQLGVKVVLPAHPRIRETLARIRETTVLGNLVVCEPVGYVDSIALQMNARVVLTDSGGVQKEAYVLGTPCVTLRDETEWIETLVDGWNVLAGRDPATIARLGRREAPLSPRRPLYGDGHASAEIARVISSFSHARSRLRVG